MFSLIKRFKQAPRGQNHAGAFASSDSAALISRATATISAHSILLRNRIAAVFINAANGTRGMIRICGAAAGAIEPCPAVAALLARINIAGGEFIAHGGVCNARPNVSEQKFINPDELMTGIQIAPRSDRHVFRAGTAARYALIYARTARKVNHIVIERERLALVIALEHKFGKLFVLFEHWSAYPVR